MMVVVRHAAQLSCVKYSALVHVLRNTVGDELSEALANELCPNTISVSVHFQDDQHHIHLLFTIKFAWQSCDRLRKHDLAEAQ